MRNSRAYFRPRRIESSISGLYCAKTSRGRIITCFAESSQEATQNLLTGLKANEYLMSVTRA